MVVLVLIIVMMVALLMGVPIAFALGVPGVIYLIMLDIPLNLVASRMFTGIDSFVLLAVPMFIIAGELMNQGGIAKRMVGFAKALVGSLPGGLGMANVVASMFLSGASGAAAADAAVMGKVLIPAMEKEGYKTGFAAALTACSSVMGPIIPPSILFVIYGMSASVSIVDLLLAGIIPGILIGLSLMIAVFICAKKNNYARGDKFSWKTLWIEFKGSFLSLMLIPSIVIVLAFGIMSPTEVSAFTVIVCLILGIYVYKDLKWKDIPKILLDGTILSGGLMFIMATNNILLYAIVHEQVGVKIGEALFSITENKILILILINVVLVLSGMIIDTLPIMLMFIPVLGPIFTAIGLDPVQGGVMVVLNLTIGLATPPVGTCLFVTSSISKTSIESISRYLPPFLISMITVLMLVTYFPAISLWVPSLF